MDDWRDKLTDHDYPLFTIGVVAEVLEVDVQVVRRLADSGICDAARPAGNQRRFSRDDLTRIAYALELADRGLTRDAIARILELEDRVADLERQLDDRGGGRGG